MIQSETIKQKNEHSGEENPTKVSFKNEIFCGIFVHCVCFFSCISSYPEFSYLDYNAHKNNVILFKKTKLPKVREIKKEHDFVDSKGEHKRKAKIQHLLNLLC